MTKKYRLNEKAWSCKPAFKLANASWTLCHEIVDRRDGHKCVLCGETENLQLDHDISRTQKTVFFETDHLNYLCSACHTSKSFNPSGVASAKVREVTRGRIGTKRLNEIIEIANKTCPQWRTLAWQESCNDQLKEYLEFVKSVESVRGWKS